MNKFKKFNKLPTIRLGKQSPVIAARVMTVCLLLLLAWALGRIAWIWVDSSNEVSMPSTSSANADLPEVKSYEIGQLLNLNFFGRYDNSGDSNNQPVPTNAPETKLNLTLVGVVASSNPGFALAVISNGGAQQVYAVGDTINNSRATLRQVMTDRVVLTNNRRDEILMLDGLEFEEISRSSQNNKFQAAAQSSSGSDSLASIKAEILGNPQSLLKYITLSQQRDDEGITGYRIGPGRDSRLFNDAGLRTDDLVVNINGSDLRDPKQMATIWQNLSDASEINLTVLRDGQEHSVLIGL